MHIITNNKPYSFAKIGKMMVILRWQWILLILLLTLVQKAWTGKRTKALFSLRESKPSDVKQTDILLNKDKELDSLLQQTKENLIKAFGLRENMISNGDKIQKREPHKYMKYIAQKYKENYKNGIPLTANTVRGCVDIGKSKQFRFLSSIIVDTGVPTIEVRSVTFHSQFMCKSRLAHPFVIKNAQTLF